MKNREIYLKDPVAQKLVNEGVANVNDDASDLALSVLRYELETFVCDGQYEKGLVHILETYLRNLNQAQQPAVWVSGFFGSGKSHLVKMLRALWVDAVFADGASARGIARLPQTIVDLLKELSTQGRRLGGLHAASGTLGAGAGGSVRLALLRIIFKSIGLPEQYPAARFVMWLRHEGIYEGVRRRVEANGLDWQEELDNFYVAEGLHEALIAIKPSLFASPLACVDTLNNLYPYEQDVSSDMMVRTIRQALSRDGVFPLTLIVLDEVQQYIGSSAERSIEVQEMVEAVGKSLGGRLLFVATGQTALTGVALLARLQGRFTVRVELSDTDVEAVIRQVILAKKPEAVVSVEAVMQANLGEISRHLAGTTISHRQDDLPLFPQDYPILPVRRRFWEQVLRVLDQTGTESQLRNQLSMVHKAIQANLDDPIGNVVPADYLYFDAADKLLQARILPRKLYEKTLSWSRGSADEQLLARACGLVFLVAKLGSSNSEIGIRATVDTLADLLVVDLAAGSAGLRSRLPALLDNCHLLMKVGDEYRIQTEESTAWTDEFLSQRHNLANERHRLEAERNDRLRRKFARLAGPMNLLQGRSRISRTLTPIFASSLPADAGEKLCVWVRDGWSVSENSVQAEARQAGNQSPIIFVFVPKRSADDLRRQLIDFKAASMTLDIRGVPNTPEGSEARAAMETTRQVAEGRIEELLDESFSGVRVFQAGGNEILGSGFKEMLQEAADNSLQRLYPQFAVADHEGWPKVYEQARKGAPDALKVIGYDGEAGRQPVCKAILAFIAGGKKGADIRNHFETAPYGWSRDAVDGGLLVLLVAGLIRAQNDHGQALACRELERKAIGKAIFKIEATTITTAQRIQLRKLFQRLGLSARQGEESAVVPAFLQALQKLAQAAGGEPPRPPLPDISFFDEIRLAAGNEQLLQLYNRRTELRQQIDDWRERARRIAEREPAWRILEALLRHAAGMASTEAFRAQAEALVKQRRLLADPDPIAPLISGLTQLLREELNRLQQQWQQQWQAGEQQLESDTNWQRLQPEQRYELRAAQQLTEQAQPRIAVADSAAVLQSLNRLSLPAFRDRLAALPARYGNLLLSAAEICEPEARFVCLPHRTLKSEAEMEAWLDEVQQQLLKALQQGPVIIK